MGNQCCATYSEENEVKGDAKQYISAKRLNSQPSDLKVASKTLRSG